MGATTSAQRDAKSPEDAAAEECGAEVEESRDGENVDEKQLQKNGQISISSLNGKADDQTDFNEHAEDNALDDVGQTDAMPQKEESSETIEELQDEVSPQVNGEQEDSEAPDADKTTESEEKTVEEKPNEANEVGFKKIFRFVGFKFTLKKDKNEKTEPVQLLTVKETEGGASEAPPEDSKEEVITEEIKPENENETDAPEAEKETASEDTLEAEKATDLPPAGDQAETVTEPAEPKQTADEQSADKETTAPEKEQETEASSDSPTSPPSQETQSPFRRFFTQGIFSNLRKKTSFKKTKEDEPTKEKTVEDIKETDEKADEAVTVEESVKEEEVEESEKTPEVPEESKAETSIEEAPSVAEEKKEKTEEDKVQDEAVREAEAAPEPVAEATVSEISEPLTADATDEAKPTDDAKPTEDKPAESSEEQQSPEKSTADTTNEAEIQSSQDKTKVQGSPLKKLFTGAGLKKLSSKKQKSKKVEEPKEEKLTESGEVVEQIQTSTESAEKPSSGASSPEESGEHVVGEASQAEANVDGESEAVTSDSEKKKDGILPWASFKKLVTPKKRVKRPSESEDEAPGEKPKSATLSSTESAVSDDKPEEVKQTEEVKDEVKEEPQAESKPETKAEKVEQSTEEPKKKIDTSVSWEALICVGSAKKRARKASDSDDEETKVEEEVQQSGEEQTKTVESPLVSSQEADNELLASSPEPEGELVSTWESFKRLVTQRKKPKAEDKSDEASGAEQTTSDSEIPKEESSFSLRKLIPRRKKKSEAKQGQASSDVGSAEEDSDTPAVVPLSEYDNEQIENAAAKATETTGAQAEVTTVTPGKPSPEDRSPSWIPATVQDVEDDADAKQLSDIPEEGDTAATPKSTDNTIAEEIVDFTSEAVTALEPAEETEMVSAVSRITASPVTSGETTPVPGESAVKKAEVILQEVVESISVTSSVMAVTVTEEQKKIVAVSTSPLEVESTIKDEKVVLVAHEKSEATAICTGLDSSKIKDVEEESPLKPAVESITVVGEALTTEVAVEVSDMKPEKAAVAEEKVFEADVSEVQTDYKEQLKVPVENAVEETAQVEAVKETPEPETVNELQEAMPVKVAVISAAPQEAEILEEPVLAENSPKVETEGPIEPTVEEPVCAQTVEVTEVAIANDEKVQDLKDIKESVVDAELAAVEGVAMALSEEVIESLADIHVAETVESKEESIPVVALAEESAVTEETVHVGLPESENEIKSEIISANVAVEGHVEIVSSKGSAVLEEVCEKIQEEVEPLQAMHMKEAEAIQEQSTVIVQEVIQNVVENIAEMLVEQKSEEKPFQNEDSSAAELGEPSKPEDVPATSELMEKESAAPFEDTKPADMPVQDETSTVDVVVQGGEPTKDTPVQEKQPEAELIPEKILTSESETKADKDKTCIVTESFPKLVTEAIQISETVPVAITDEIKSEQEEIATVTLETMQQDADVVKHEVELKEAEKKVEEEKTAEKSTESEDGKSKVEEDLKELQDKIQQPSIETPSETAKTEESSETTQTTTVVITKEVQLIEEQCQQEVKIETTTEIKVGIINVVDADEGAVQVTEKVRKEDDSKSQEPSEDKTQTVLEEVQKNTSTQDITSQEGPGDSACQKADATVSEVKTAVEESVNAIKEEEGTKEVEKEIDPISTEITTVS